MQDPPPASTGKIAIPDANAGQFMFTPPAQFDFKHPELWDRWLNRFERYRMASGLSEQSSERQATTLMYCLGEEAEDVLAASALTSEERKNYAKVKNHFTDVFIGKRNIIYERAVFNSRSQKNGESFESFVTDLRKLVHHCSYGTLRDELIRDRIVVGILDKKLSEQLQCDAELTLEKALAKCRQKEALRHQQAECVQSQKKSPLSGTKKPAVLSATKSESCWFCGSAHCPTYVSVKKSGSRVVQFRSTRSAAINT